MALELEIKDHQEITQNERKEIDEFIEYAIDVHKGNSSQINRLVMDSVTALTISEARSEELAGQGFGKKLWNGITGKNQKIRADIDRNLAKSQYASQQMIQKLAEQNLLAFDTITAVNNKLNTLMLDVDEEINKIYQTLVVFFKQTRSDLIQMESRMDKVERNVELLHWNSTIEYQMYDGVEYSDLPDFEKIICVTNDFYHLTKGQWSTSDLMLLKSTLSDIGLPVKSKVSLMQFLNHLAKKPSLTSKLFENTDVSMISEIEPYQAPLMKGIDRLNKFQNEDKYLVDTVTKQLELANVPFEFHNIQVLMVDEYLLSRAFVQTKSEIGLFDIVIELASNIAMLDNFKPFDEILEATNHEVTNEELSVMNGTELNDVDESIDQTISVDDVVEFICNKFQAANSIDLRSDSMSLNRVIEAASEIEEKLNDNESDSININLPFITVSAMGPLHLDYDISIIEIRESCECKIKNYSLDKPSFADKVVEFVCSQYELEYGVDLRIDKSAVEDVVDIIEDARAGLNGNLELVMDCPVSIESESISNTNDIYLKVSMNEVKLFNSVLDISEYF